MKKKQDIVKKGFSLTKETLRVLHASQLDNVAGGGISDGHTSCGYPRTCTEA